MEHLWSDLRSADATRAYQALWSFTAAEGAVRFLKGRLRPVLVPGEPHLSRLLADLDSDRFAVREQAAVELQRLGLLAEPALRQALEGKPSLEVRRRVEQLLGKLQGSVVHPNTLRALRAVEALEHIGNPEARQVLESLAKGVSQARLTQEARASLERLAKRPVARP
jgi:HEAT repeat protein